MEYLTDKEFCRKMKMIHLKNEQYEKKKLLKEEENKYKKKITLPSTSKLMAAYLFIILNVVLIYAMVIMAVNHDLSSLGALITDVAAQVLTYCIYSIKSYKENTSSEGFIYQVRMKDLNGVDNAVG